jgi:Peptidylarginine deiminase and related enzymes
LRGERSPQPGGCRARVARQRVEVLGVAAEDNWLRDCGPIFLLGERGRLGAASFRFNCWGEKYQPYDGCQQVGQDIARAAGAQIFNSHMVLEGGAFYVDGQGTLVTTESCLLHPNRNPHMNRAEIEAELRRMLGVEKIVWLPGNPDEVETNGHVDGIASFIAPGKMLCQSASPVQGDYFQVMRENRRALELATDAAGRRLNCSICRRRLSANAMGPSATAIATRTTSWSTAR